MEYKYYTNSETELSSIENQNFSNDFEINNPVDFKANYQLSPEELNQYINGLNLIGIKNPAEKLNIDAYEAVKSTLKMDFKRLVSALNIMSLNKLDKLVFITIGNSMESYGYILNKVFGQYKIGHIKVSRTLKDNIDNHLGKGKSGSIFHKYFEQKINEIIKNHEGLEAVIIIDTFGAGETMSTILWPFIQKGITGKPFLRVLPFCLLEGGHTRPTTPFDKNIELVHFTEAGELILKMDFFRKNAGETLKMPVFLFNEYIPLKEVEVAIDELENNKTELVKSNELVERFGVRKLKIFIEIQRLDLRNGESFVVIPSNTTRLLSRINPYFTVGQKTVFVIQEKQTNKFITRDGHGFSRKEKPPVKLHRLNNYTSFLQLSITDKLNLLFNKSPGIFNKVSDEVKDLVYTLNNDDLNQMKDAFESYLRKKIIYHFINEFEAFLSQN